MDEVLSPKVLVLGGGPGGYVAAIRCGQLGLDTVLVEGDRLGGTCLVRGCIPSKALIHAAAEYETVLSKVGEGHLGIRLAAPPSLDFAATIRWKDGIVDRLTGGVGGLLKRAKVRVVTGWGQFTDAKTCMVRTGGDAITIRPEHVILAAGSVPVALPGLALGGEVISSTEALSLAGVPERLAIIGAGCIGLELGIAFRKLGAAVSIIEAQDRILPLYDRELTDPVRRWLDRAGVAVHLDARASGFEDGALMVDSGGMTTRLPADKVLVTVGRAPRIDGWGLETMAVDLAGGFVRVDERCHTSMRNVWAIGDLVGEPMLAHKASAQGEMVAEIIAGQRRRFDPATIAAVCFTEPEIVSAGLLPAEAAKQGDATIVARFPFAASGRALSMDRGEGFVRVVARKSTGQVLGIQAVGAQVSELAGEFALAIEMAATLEDIAGTIHVHPTLGEGLHEAALAALGHPMNA